MIKYLQHQYALSKKGAADMVKAFVACTVYFFALMFPVGLLYLLVSDLMGGKELTSNLTFYTIGIVACLALVALTTYIQYNATYLSTYKESGVRRITLTEKLQKSHCLSLVKETSPT